MDLRIQNPDNFVDANSNDDSNTNSGMLTNQNDGIRTIETVPLSNVGNDNFIGDNKVLQSDTLEEINNEIDSKLNADLIEALKAKDIDKITVHPSLNSIPQLSIEEFSALEADILERGMLEPIILTQDYQCINGRARLEIYLKNPSQTELHFKFIEIQEDEILEYIVRTSILRRNLNKGKRAVCAVKIYEYVKEKREKNKEFSFLGIRVDIGEKSRTAVAKYFSISPTLLNNAYTIYKNAPELIEAILGDTLTFNEAFNLATGKNSDYSDSTPDNVDIPENPSEQPIEDSTSEEAKTIAKYEEKRRNDSSSGEHADKTPKLSPRLEFEQNFRTLKPLELAIIDFITEDLKISRSEEMIITLLSKEEEQKKAINLERTDDEKFDKLCQFFMDLLLTASEPEIERLKYSAKIEEIKKQRIENEIMSFTEQVNKLQSLISKDGKDLLELAQKQFNEKAKNELNVENTLYGKVFFFIRKCARIISEESKLRQDGK